MSDARAPQRALCSRPARGLTRAHGTCSLLPAACRATARAEQIYGEIARRHTSQIRHVYIRNVATKKVGKTSVAETRERLAPHFRGVPEDAWTVFEHADALAAASDRLPWLHGEEHGSPLPAQSFFSGLVNTFQRRPL